MRGNSPVKIIDRNFLVGSRSLQENIVSQATKTLSCSNRPRLELGAV